MRAAIFLLWILLSTMTSFAYGEEETPLSLLHQQGMVALQNEEYATAQNIFKTLLERITVNPVHSSLHKCTVDWPTYIEVSLSLATCYEALDEKDNAEILLNQLLTQKPPHEFIPKITWIKAKITATQHCPTQAYFDMTSLSKNYPLCKWPVKELSFFHALEESLNDYHDQLITKSKRYMHAGLYKEASCMYEEVLHAIKKGTYPKIKIKDGLSVKKIKYFLSKCYFLENYQKLFSPLNSQSDLTYKQLQKQLLYLSAECYKKKQEYEKAIESFDYNNNAFEREEYLHSHFEIATFFYQNNLKSEAKVSFEKLQFFSGKLSSIAALYLAHIYLEEKQPYKAQALLNPLEACFEEKNQFRAEYYYLRGLSAFQSHNFLEAKQHFEQVFYEKEGACWRDATFHLGWCFLWLSYDPLKNRQEKIILLKQAEKTFKFLSIDEAAQLALAQIYLIQFNDFQDGDSLDKMNQHLEEHAEDLSPEGTVHALLIKAAVQQEYSTKEALYAQATQEQFQKCSNYFQAWYWRGVNFFQRALQDSQQRSLFFNLAKTALEKALLYSMDCHTDLMHQVLVQDAYKLLSNIFEKQLLPLSETPAHLEEILYLRGLLASCVPGMPYFLLAENVFLKLTHLSQSTYQEGAFNALILLYYQSGKYEKILELLTQIPQNQFSLFSAVKYIFQHSSFLEYLEDNPTAIEYLERDSQGSSDSPLYMLSYYLKGVHERDEKNALFFFEESIKSYMLLYSQDCMSNEKNLYPADSKDAPRENKLESLHFYCYYQTLLRLSEMYLNSESAKDRIRGHHLLSLLTKNFPFFYSQSSDLSHIQEREFQLARYFLYKGDVYQAQKIFSKLLIYFCEAGVGDNKMLKWIWEEQISALETPLEEKKHVNELIR